MTRTADLIVVHDTDDKRARESLGQLLRAGEKTVEIEWLSERLAVAMIGPADLENSTNEEEER